MNRTSPLLVTTVVDGQVLPTYPITMAPPHDPTHYDHPQQPRPGALQYRTSTIATGRLGGCAGFYLALLDVTIGTHVHLTEKHLCTGSQSINPWHKSSSTRTHISIMGTMAVGEPPLTGADSPSF
jgi:hypothetical protein